MSNYCMSKGVFCDMATGFGFCRVTACMKKYHCGAEGERGMIIQIGTEVDESRILWLLLHGSQETGEVEAL